MGRCLPKYQDNSLWDARQIIHMSNVKCPTDYLSHSLWFVQKNSMILRKTTDKTAIIAKRCPTKYWKYSTQDFQKILITLSVRCPSKYRGNSRWNTPKYIKNNHCATSEKYEVGNKHFLSSLSQFITHNHSLRHNMIVQLRQAQVRKTDKFDPRTAPKNSKPDTPEYVQSKWFSITTPLLNTSQKHYIKIYGTLLQYTCSQSPAFIQIST
jgi:hypothetical protein